MIIIPLHNYLLVRPLPPEDDMMVPAMHRQIGQIVVAIRIPKSAKRYIFEGEVLAVGPGNLDYKTGQRCPVEASIGDIVQYPNTNGLPVRNGGQDYLLLQDTEILCKVKKLPPNPEEACQREELPLSLEECIAVKQKS